MTELSLPLVGDRPPLPRLRAIAAVSLNGVIGRDGKIPWTCSEDMSWFRAMTTGKTLVMGSRTFESVGALQNRHTLVVTRDCSTRRSRQWEDPGVGTFELVQPAHVFARLGNDHPSQEFWLCGGAVLYHWLLPLCSELYVTLIKQVVEGDAHFPPVSACEFRVARVLRDTPEFQVVRMVNAKLC